MAYLQAISGIARSGVTYCGWTKPAFRVLINGTDRTAMVQRDGDWSISDRLGEPSTFVFSLYGITPTLGHDVKVLYSASNDYLFGGTLLEATADCDADTGSVVIWRCVAVGYQWLLRSYPVRKQYRGIATNTVIGDLLSTYTDGDFRVGYVPQLGYVNEDYNGQHVPDILDGIAAAFGATWEVTPDKVVNLSTTYPRQSLALSNSSDFRGLRLRKDMTQTRTLTYQPGQATTVTARVPAGSTSIPIAEVSIFRPDAAGGVSGLAVSGSNWMSYDVSAMTTTNGPGSLPSVAGVNYDIAEGDEIAVLQVASGGSAALAAVLGGSGRIYYVRPQDKKLTMSGCYNVAFADNALYQAALEDVEYHTRDRTPWVGGTVVSTVTVPTTVSGTYLIREIRITQLGDVGSMTVDIDRHLFASLSTRAWSHLRLREVLQ